MRTCTVLLVVVFVLLVGACERMRWNECRRVHPFWYCFDAQGRK